MTRISFLVFCLLLNILRLKTLKIIICFILRLPIFNQGNATLSMCHLHAPPGTKTTIGCHASKCCLIECQETGWPAHKFLYRSFKCLTPCPKGTFCEWSRKLQSSNFRPRLMSKNRNLYGSSANGFKDSGVSIEQRDLENYLGSNKALIEDVRVQQ